LYPIFADVGMLDSAPEFHVSQLSIHTTCRMLQCRLKTASYRACRVMHRLTTLQHRTPRTAAARMLHFCFHSALYLMCLMYILQSHI